MTNLEEFIISPKQKKVETTNTTNTTTNKGTTLEEFLVVDGNKSQESNDAVAVDVEKVKINISDFETKYKAVLSILNNNSLLVTYKKVLTRINFSKLNENTRKEIIILFNNFVKSNELSMRIKLIGKLQEIVNKYENKKQEAVGNARSGQEGVSEDVANAPKIQNYKKFILDLLEAKDGWENRIESSINEAEKLSETEIVEKIKGTSVYFDVEPEDWDIYFKENNIPKEKQDQFKKYYTKLKGRKTDWIDIKLDKEHDFGNISFINDFGDDITDEAERILNLPEGSTITIRLKDLNPSSGNLEFKDKKSALLYLYYTKLLFKEVGTFLEDIKQGMVNIKNGVGNFIEFIMDHPGETIWTLIGYMGIATFGSVIRYTNAFFIRAQSGGKKVKWHNPITWVPTKGDLINIPNDGESTAIDPKLKKEQDEGLRRKKVIEMLKEKYKGNNKKLKQIKKVEKKYMRILDHDVQIEGRNPPFEEGTFWREIAYIEADGFKGKRKIIDILFKLFLKSSEENETSIENKVKLYEEAKEEISKNKGILEQTKIFLKRSHTIPNNIEIEIITFFEELEKKYENGEFYHLKGKNIDELVEEIKKDIIKKLNSKFNGLNLTEDIFKGGNNLKDARELFFDGYNDFEPERGTNKKDKWVENLFEKDSLTDEQLSEIKKFFAEIHKGDNEYNQRTALDILARIIKKGLTYKQAINESFNIKWDYIKQINIDSDLKGSLDNLLTEIESGRYSLEVNENTRRNDINILEESEEVIEKTQEKGFIKKHWGKIKNFKLFKNKTPEEAEDIIENADEKTKKSFTEYLNKYSELKEKFNLYLEKREAKKIIKKTIKYIKSVKNISDKDRKGILETLNEYKNNIEKTLIGKNKLERINNLKKLINTLIDYEKIKIDKVELNIEKNNRLKEIKENIINKLRDKIEEIKFNQESIDNINSYNSELAKKQKLIESIKQTTDIDEIVDILIKEYGEVDKIPDELLSEDFRVEFRIQELQQKNPRQFKAYMEESSYEEVLRQFHIDYHTLIDINKKILEKQIENIRGAKGNEKIIEAREKFLKSVKRFKNIK